jgi:hypothetical protein
VEKSSNKKGKGKQGSIVLEVRYRTKETESRKTLKLFASAFQINNNVGQFL